VADYAITVSRPARKELERLPARLVERIFPKVESLSQQPRPTGCKKLRGAHNLWRIRVGDYRVVYTVDDALRAVDIVAVRHRSEAYRD
jgi:mRNA interferase RelE/StbE